jgi:hypothetical protein
MLAVDHPDQPAIVVLRLGTWTRGITPTKGVEEPDERRFIRCEAAIVEPLGILLEGEVTSGSTVDGGAMPGGLQHFTWDALPCHLSLLCGEATVYERKTAVRQPLEGGLGFFNFSKGFVQDDYADPPSIDCWVALEDEDFHDVWQLVGANRQGEVLITLTVVGGIHYALTDGDTSEFRWNIDRKKSLKIMSVQLTFGYAQPQGSSHATPSDRRGALSGEIQAVHARFLERNLAGEQPDGSPRQFYSQFNDLARQITERIAHYSMAHGESRDECGARLRDAFRLLTSVRAATNEYTRPKWSRPGVGEAVTYRADPEQAHTIWGHGDVQAALEEGYASDHARKVDVTALQAEARRYLLRPWMENELLEWIIVDALMFATLTASGEDLKMRSGPLNIWGVNKLYFSATGNVTRMFWKRIRADLEKFVVTVAIFVAAPLFAGLYSWRRGHTDAVVLAGSTYAGLLVLYFAYTAFRSIVTRKRRAALETHSELLTSMWSAYQMMNGEVISPAAVRELLLDTARRGASWPGAIFAVLDHAIRRNPALWRSADTDRYDPSTAG